MRILLINQYAGSPRLGMAYRPHWMATEWRRLGHEVLIVAGDYSHLRREQPRRGLSDVEGVQFLALATPRYGDNGPRRFLNITAFRAQLYRSLRQLSDWRPDVVVASSTHPMDIRPGLALARRCDALFVHEIHDLWPLTPRLLGGMSERHPMIMWMQREENLACREADLVVSMLPATLPYLEEHGLDADRWVYVSNGVPDEVVAGELKPSPRDEHAFTIGYFGGHALSNGLDVLIEAARLLRDRPIDFHLTGSGALKADLQRAASDLVNVHFHPQVPPGEARKQMRSMDVLCITAKPSPLYEHGISPNKLFDYMAAGRPVLLAISSPLNPVEIAKCGSLCQHGDPKILADEIIELLSMPTERLDELGRSGHRYIRAEATYSKLAEKFIEAIQQARELK